LGFIKKTGIVITFDDGYAGNLINALPLLEKYNIPATIFVTTLNIDENKEFWWDRLVFDYTACNELFNIPDSEDQILKSKSEYKNINDRLDKLTNHDKEKWFLAFEKMNQIPFFPRKEYRSLTKSELKLLSEHPLISIGIHTHNHYPLENLTYEGQKQEFLLSITKLNELTNKSIKYLTLPHGSYNLNTLEIA
jgi:peptidoglycan/xylan/chitin deacetylase (PgdA/CDA1 family)